MHSGNKDLQEVQDGSKDQDATQEEGQAKYEITLQQMKDTTTKFKA